MQTCFSKASFGENNNRRNNNRLRIRQRKYLSNWGGEKRWRGSEVKWGESKEGWEGSEEGWGGMRWVEEGWGGCEEGKI